MSETQPSRTPTLGSQTGWTGVVNDYAGDRAAFRVSANKTMMWIFLLSDTFVFGCFLVGYMSVRMTTTDIWPPTSEVFALTIAGHSIPLILIAIMTFVLITSSGTMAMAVNCGYQGKRWSTALLMLITALLGLTFVGMQAFEWSKLIAEGVRPWGNEDGASQFGAAFFMITGFHGLHVSVGVLYLTIVAIRVALGKYDKQGVDPHAAGIQGGRYEIVEITGLYWHFVDLVWVFIFAFFYLW